MKTNLTLALLILVFGSMTAAEAADQCIPACPQPVTPACLLGRSSCGEWLPPDIRCPGPSVANGHDSCVACALGYVKLDNNDCVLTCKPSAAGMPRPDFSNACACPNHLVYGPDSGCTCPAGAQYDSSRQDCFCQAGFVLAGNQCVKG